MYMELYIRKIIINESVYNSIEAKLASKALLRYHFNRVDVTTHIVQGKCELYICNIPKLCFAKGGILHWESSSLFNPDQVPPKILIGFQSQRRIQGSWKLR